MDNNEVKDSLQEVINISKDGAEGYEAAADQIENSDLRTIFLRLSQQRKGFVETLKNEALRAGHELDANGTVKGFFHRTWLSTKATFSSDTNEKVIEEARTGEKAAVETYDEALKHELPEYLVTLLKEQQQQIKAALTQLQEFRVAVS